jgi:gamma-glutamyltranspeptidase/glutathione hydrolase
MRDFNTGRSAVYAENGMAATAHPMATLAALDILRSGGNAVDAAIAAIALLGVIEPQSTGIGGDGFVLFAPKGGRPLGYNGSGRAPMAATLDWYAKAGITQLGDRSPHAVTVPGAVDLWFRLQQDHGSRPMAEILAPAIRAAERGYTILPRVAADWVQEEDKLRSDPHAARRFLKDGRAYRIGEKHVQPELAETLKRMVSEGRDGFYKGPVAADMVARLNELGGLHTPDDFELQTADHVVPISTRYRDHEVYEIPPNGQGITALIMLNVLQGFQFGSDSYSHADRIHLIAEAAKAAYHRRDTHVGDPHFVEVPVERLLSDAEAKAIRATIRLDRALPPPAPPVMKHTDTTYVTVVDRDLNAVSFINSVFQSFGSGILAPKSGVMLHNRGLGFRLTEGHPSAIAPGKRPMHTIIPGMLCRGEECVMPFGVMGGQYQPVGHTSLLTNMLDLGMDPQQAIEAPRHFASQGNLGLEDTVPASVAEDLRQRGHRVTRVDEPLGGAQAIWIDRKAGLLIGGSESRKDGCALGF